MSNDQALNELNHMLAKYFPMARQPRYRYYSDWRGSRYFWTTEKCKCRHGNDKHYVCGIYRHYKEKRQYKLVRRLCFATRKRAKAWALKEVNKSDELHAANEG